MIPFQEDHLLINDREDLLALLEMRFGSLPAELVEEIQRIQQPDRLMRLILVAANAADWQVFVEELHAEAGSFKLTGERFNPANHQ